MSTLPLFPLSMVVFPGEELNLHIFEPRYKQLIHDCLKDNISFGIPPYFEGKSLINGTELTVKEVVRKYADGKLDIKATAIGWFEIDEFYRILHGKLYPGGTIRRMQWDSNPDVSLSVKLISLISELYRLLNIINVKIQPPSSFRTFQVAHKIGLSTDQELVMLTMVKETDRQIFLIEHLEVLLPVMQKAEAIRKRAELNGHFQHIIPPDF